MKLIVGLGNPSQKYEGTRHNVGFTVIDVLAEEYHITVNSNHHKALCGKGWIAGESVLLAKPLTYMNLSGESVRPLADYYKVEPEDILIIYDDIFFRNLLNLSIDTDCRILCLTAAGSRCRQRQGQSQYRYHSF